MKILFLIVSISTLLFANTTGDLYLTDRFCNSKDIFKKYDTLYICLYDQDLNTNNQSAQTEQISVRSFTENSGEIIILTEITNDTSLFKGYILFEETDSYISGDGILQISPNDTITSVYFDISDDNQESQTINKKAFYLGNCKTGSISSNTTWTKQESPYIITGTITVPQNITLTIEAGTQILMQPNSNDQGSGDIFFDIQGILKALGTENDSITFSSNSASAQTDDWKGIKVSDSVLLEYCSISYSTYGAYCTNSSSEIYLQIQNSSFLNTGSAVYVSNYNSNSVTHINNSNILLTGYNSAIYFDGNNAGSSGDSILIENNTINISDGIGIEIENRIYSTGHKKCKINNNSIYGSNPFAGSHITITNSDSIVINQNEFNTAFAAIRQFSGNGNYSLNNDFKNNAFNIFVDGGTIKGNYNNFFGAMNLSLVYAGEDPCNMMFNYWDSAATNQMNNNGNPKNITAIYDYYDNSIVGKVKYAGWLDTADGTPASYGTNGNIELTDKYLSPKAIFAVNDTVYIKVEDSDINKDTLLIDTCTINIFSSTEASGELLKLSEIAVDTNIFSGYIITQNSSSAQSNDGVLQILGGEDVVAKYTDSLNDYGELDTLTANGIYGTECISGIINQNTTWTKSESPYIVTGTITIPKNITLTIEPGVVVKFIANSNDQETGDSYIKADGKLNAQGTASDSIYFYSNSLTPDSKDWKSIEANDSLILKYCLFKHADTAINASIMQNNKFIKISKCFFDSCRTPINFNNSTDTSILCIDSSFINNKYSSPAINISSSCENDSIFILNNMINLNFGQGIKISNRKIISQNNKKAILSNNTITGSAITHGYGININNSDSVIVNANKTSNILIGIRNSSGNGSIISENTIQSCRYNIYIDEGTPIINYNNLYLPEYYAVANQTSDSINCLYNYWDQAPTQEMNSGSNPKDISVIFDNFDQTSSGFVVYNGWLNSKYIQNSQNCDPTITSSPIDTAIEFWDYTYDVEAQDTDNDTLVYSLLTSPSGMTINSATGEISWYPVKNDVGEHSVNIFVSDQKGGSASQAFVLEVILNNPPHFEDIADTLVFEETIYQTTVSAPDPENDNVIYSLVQNPDNMTIDSISGQINWLPQNSNVGTNSIKICAFDQKDGYDTLSFNLNVLNTNDAPYFVSSPIINAVQDSQYVYNASANDTDNVFTLTYAIITAPESLTIDSSSGLIEWMPKNNDVGLNNVSILVKDDSLAADTQSFVIDVQNINDPPYFTSTPDTFVFEDNEYVYNFDIKDIDNNDHITATLIESPENMTLDTITNTLLWTPDINDTGTTVDVSIKAEDLSGANVFQQFSINIIAKKRYIITSNSGNNGNMHPSGSIEIKEKDSIGIFITPDEYYIVDSVFINGKHRGSMGYYKFRNTQGDSSIYATFKKVSHTISVSADDNGTANPIGDISVSSGNNLTIDFIPDPGYKVNQIIVNGEQRDPSDSYTFENIRDDSSLQVNFIEFTGIENKNSYYIPEKNSNASEKIKFEIYPVPQQKNCNDLTFSFNSNDIIEFEIYIFDILGTLVKKVKKQVLSQSESIYNWQFKYENIKPGPYIVFFKGISNKQQPVFAEKKILISNY